MTIKAKGDGSEVIVENDKVMVTHGGLGSFFKQAARVYKEGPAVLSQALQGPSRNVLLSALTENKDLALVLVRSLRDQSDGPTDEEVAAAEGDRNRLLALLQDAFRNNRAALAQALRDNSDLVTSWLKNHKELLGIFLKGDVHLFIEDVKGAEVADARGGKRRLTLEPVGGDDINVEYDPAKEEDFGKVVAVLGQEADGAVSSASDTKVCPMCAEDVKAAAVVCRFCGHRFE